MTRRMLLADMFVVLSVIAVSVHAAPMEKSGFDELMRRPPPVLRQNRMARLNNVMQETGVSMSEALAAEESQRIVGLTILVDFPDQPANVLPETVYELLNRRGGIGGNSASGSVFDYFYDVSGGLLEYTNIVTPVTLTYTTTSTIKINTSKTKKNHLFHMSANSKRLNITLAESGSATYSVYDLQGKQIISNRFFGNKASIDISHLPPKMYNVAVKQGNRKHSASFIKRR